MNQQSLNLKSSILALSHSAALLTYLVETDHGMLYNTIQHSAPLWGMNQQPLNLKSSILALSHSAALLTYLDETDHAMLYNTIQHSAPSEVWTSNPTISSLALSHSASLLTYLDETDHGMLYNTIQQSASWWGMDQQPLNLQSSTEPLSSATHLPGWDWSWHAI